MVQEDFWSANPCGADGGLSQVTKQRHRMEPWLCRELRSIPVGCGAYLEVGCGQGADAFFVCSLLQESDEYIAIDYSLESIERAASFMDEARNLYELKVTPQFSLGNALELPFDDNAFDFVYSMGVLHHTPDPQKSFNEIFRVLKPGGQAKLFLYRRGSLKVGAAKALRGIQRMGDVVLSQERFIYRILKGQKSDFFGSMFLECFGVPWMEWYSREDLERAFANFSQIDVKPYGYNLPRRTHDEVDGFNPFGYYYKIDLAK